MNPVNATSLYVSASRSVLQCDPRDPRALAELCKLLPFFRQSVSCLVCGECVCLCIFMWLCWNTRVEIRCSRGARCGQLCLQWERSFQ